jgi:hypothetical protein
MATPHDALHVPHYALGDADTETSADHRLVVPMQATHEVISGIKVHRDNAQAHLSDVGFQSGRITVSASRSPAATAGRTDARHSGSASPCTERGSPGRGCKRQSAARRCIDSFP